MARNNNIREHLREQVREGVITAAEANVKVVRAERFHLVVGVIPRDVRSALNAAVKDGRLRRLPKDGAKPECYYHPDFEYLAKGERVAIAEKRMAALAGVFA